MAWRVKINSNEKKAVSERSCGIVEMRNALIEAKAPAKQAPLAALLGGGYGR